MKRALSFFLCLLLVIVFSNNSLSNAYAQTPASNSAITPTLPLLPTLLPTQAPEASSSVSFTILQQLEFSNSVASTSSTATVAATQDNSIAPTPDVSPSPTPDIIASGSAEDYCLNVPVIMYHHVEPLDIATQLGHAPLTEDDTFFEQHLSYLASHHYHFLALEDLVHAIINRKPVPPKSVVITIDDGYIDAYTYAFLYAKKYHAIVNFMIPTGLIGQPDYMLWDHLKEMNKSPYVRLYNHTTSHAALGLIDQDQIIQEVTTANQDLQKNLGIKNDIVVYPYGSYNDLAIQTIQQLGMIAAVSTDPGTNECLSNIYKLPRVRVGDEPIQNYGY